MPPLYRGLQLITHHEVTSQETQNSLEELLIRTP